MAAPGPGRFPSPQPATAGVTAGELSAREDVMAKKDKRSKKVKKLVREGKKEAKKDKKKSNTEVDRSDVKPPSPFSS